VSGGISWRGRAYRLARGGVERSAGALRLATYSPIYEYREQLRAHTNYREDARQIRDKRPTTDLEGQDVTLTVEGLEDVLTGRGWEGKRLLEVGPKYGVHSRWIDQRLHPSELVFSDFAADKHRHDPWIGEITAPTRWVYGDLATATELLDVGQVDCVFFLGVLYHSVFHLPLLGMLNRITKPGGEMLLETTIDPRPDAAVRLRWQQGTGKAKAVPTVDGLRLELAWTGWRDVTRFVDYRPGSSEALFLCRKTDELADRSDLTELVAPQRREPGVD